MRYADKPISRNDSVWNVEGSTPIEAVVNWLKYVLVIEFVMNFITALHRI